MSETLKRYLEQSAPHDFVVEATGRTWRVRRMTGPDWGAIWGGLLSFSRKLTGTDSKSDQGQGAEPKQEAAPEAVSVETADRQALYRKLMYEQLVMGLVDPDTQEVLKIPYESVLGEDFGPIVQHLEGMTPNTEAKSEAIARGL